MSNDATPTDLLRRAGAELALRGRTARLPSVGDPSHGAEPGDRSSRLVPAAIAIGAAVLAIAAGKLLLPDGLPNGVIVLGVVLGALNALPALGVVLVYRSNRIVNFAQGELGAFAASLAYLLITTLHWPWAVAVPVALAAAGAVGGAVEFGIMRRFFASPRLLVTVATIGVTQLLGGLRLGLPQFFPDLPGFAGTFPSPLQRPAFSIGSAVFAYDHVVIIAVVPIATAAVALFLRGSWAGLGTRAAAGNLDRSRLLGIPVRRLSTIVWVVAGLLSGLTAILRAPVAGFSLIGATGTSLMTRILAPAAVGGFSSLPITFAAAVVLGVVEQAFFWNFSRGGPIETVLLGALVVGLLVRSRRARAFEQADATSSWAAVREATRLPRRLAARPEVRVAGLWAGFVALQVLLLAPRWLAPGKVALVGLMGIHVIVGLSLVVLTGWAGQISLGHWAIVGVGAFVAGNLVVRFQADLFVVLVIGAVAGGLVSLLLGLPAQRLPGIMFGVTTLGFAAAAKNWLFELDWVTRGATVRRPVLFGRFSLESSEAFYYVTLVATALAVLAVWNAKRYRLADVLLAARDNPRAAEAFGIGVTAARRLAFFLSGCLAGVAGVLYAFHQQVVVANRFPAELGLSVLAMVVIGGLGSIPGAVLGAVIIRGTEYLLPGWAHFFVSGVGLLLVLLVFPGGLGEALFRVRDRLVAWFAGEGGRLVDRRDVGVDTDVAPTTARLETVEALT